MLKSLSTFRLLNFVLKPHVERTKLTTKSRLCVFLGYGSGQKGYRCYDHVGRKLYTSSHVQFLEHVPYFSVLASSHHLTQPELIKLDPFDDATETPQETPQEIPQKTPQETPTDTETPHVTIVTKPPPMATQSSTEVVIGPPPSGRPKRNCKSTKRDDFVYSCYSHSFNLFIAYVHRLHEPMSYREAVCDPLWQVAMAEELAALHQTQTWHLVRLLGAIGSRWVYRIKTKYDGSIERYKARLVAKGYAQEYGMNYEETFAPVLKMTMVKTLIAVSSSRKWKISQLYVKNAFLNGDLNEEVLMTPPPGVSHKPGEVCKLRKALYGLKQAPRAWYEKFATVVTSFGFVSSHHDSTLFVKQSSVGRTLLSLYVDDMIITVDDCVGIESLKLELAYRFAMKDLGLLHYFLDKLVEDIPFDAKAKYTPTDGQPFPDPIHIMSQFVSAPTTVHWAAVLHILRYLCGTQFQTLFFPSTSALDLRAYCDSDWAGDVVSPEYRAMAVTTSEIVWLRWLLADMGIRISHSTLLHCDNHSAIQIACNSLFHERTKHIEIDCHFTRHHLQAGTISLPFVSSALQIADLFTKPHSGSRFRFLNEKHSMFLAAALRV
ncbi:retrovirus-related pol polyprotein from transposon TNT 1-94 [Tanacetum coccineum]